MPRVHTQKARKDYPSFNIKAGDSYYWWKFRHGGKRMSKNYPRRQQLTQSDFLCQVYDLEDRLGEIEADDVETLQSEVESIISDIESLKDDTESNLSGVPDHLQESHINTRRIESLDEWIDELNGIDYAEDEDDEDWLQNKKEEISGIGYNGE